MINEGEMCNIFMTCREIYDTIMGKGKVMG